MTFFQPGGITIAMCTLTLIPWHLADGVGRAARVVCNRDESVLRPVALPPEMRSADSRRVVLPVDPLGGGTWIGASDAPLVGVLMNVYVAQAEPVDALLPAEVPKTTRGSIVPRMLAANGLAEALQWADRLDVSQFEPFRLILVNTEAYAEVVWSAGQYSVSRPLALERPVFFTSSGMGDDVVARPRQTLFDEMFANAADWPAAQEAFHRHQWPGRELASVWMTRPEARTQSITWVELRESGVEMRYQARRGTSHELEPATVCRLDVAPG